MRSACRPAAAMGLAACLGWACATGPARAPPGPAAGGEGPHPTAAVPDGKPAPASAEAPGAVLQRFVDALEAGRWAQASQLLSARWRAAYTPARLEADYAGAGPVAGEAAARVRSALRAGLLPQVEDGRASLTMAGGRAALVAEPDGWRVDALE